MRVSELVLVLMYTHGFLVGMVFMYWLKKKRPKNIDSLPVNNPDGKPVLLEDMWDHG